MHGNAPAPPAALDLFRALLDQSRLLALATAAGDWDAVEAGLAERRRLMDLADGLPTPVTALSPALQAQIRTLLAEAAQSDEAAVRSLREQMSSLTAEMGDLYRVRDVMRTYGDALRSRPGAPRFLDSRQ